MNMLLMMMMVWKMNVVGATDDAGDCSPLRQRRSTGREKPWEKKVFVSDDSLPLGKPFQPTHPYTHLWSHLPLEEGQVSVHPWVRGSQSVITEKGSLVIVMKVKVVKI